MNGNSIAGTNSPIFSTNTLTDSAVIECRMTVPECNAGGGSTKDYSDPIVIRVPPLLKPSVAISTNTATACKGSAVNFSATASQAGSNPIYNWYINDTSTSFSGSTFTTASIKDGDKISCQFTIDASLNCNVPAAATSNIIVMIIKDLLDPRLTISTNTMEICTGQTIIVRSELTGGGTNPLLQWQVNGLNAGANSINFSSGLFKDGDVISCKATTISGCNSAAATSNTITITVNKSPVITINTDSSTIWAGGQTQLKTVIDGDIDSFNWEPAGKLNNPFTLNPTSISLLSNTTYIINAVSTKGCKASKEVLIKVRNRLNMPNSFTPNKDGINDVFRIPPGVQMELNDFSIYDRWGNRIFFTSDPAKGWDGSYKGIPLNAGSYLYLINGRYEAQPITLKGYALLIR